MSERFMRVLGYIFLSLGVVAGMVFCVIGGITEGWQGVLYVLAALVIYIILLYLYNRKNK